MEKCKTFAGSRKYRIAGVVNPAVWTVILEARSYERLLTILSQPTRLIEMITGHQYCLETSGLEHQRRAFKARHRRLDDL